MTCDHCGHDWHGLPCAHAVVVRLGWLLGREGCGCASALSGEGWSGPLATAG